MISVLLWKPLTIDVSNPKAVKLLEDLEALNLIKVVNRQTKPTGQKLSEKLYGSISDKQAKLMTEELRQMRAGSDRAI